MNVEAAVKAERAKRELARRHFRHYLPYVHKGWKKTRMSEFIADTIQEFVEADTGHAYDVLVLETPPQHGKSMTVTESFPSWYMGRYPTHRVICASYNEEFSERFCRRNKEKIQTFGKNLFGIQIGATNRVTEFELDNNVGRMICRGIRSGITGNSANLIVIDDPVKNREEADSETFRDKVWEEWQNSLKSRLQAGSKVIIIMTPWHEDDLAARVLSSETNVRLVRLPVEAEEDDPLGRPVGDALAPELGKDNNWLHDFKESYINDPMGGARAWAALYQCSPRVEDGNIIKREWWQYFNPKDIEYYGSMAISVDATFKKTDTSDFVAITVWGKLFNDYYCLYCLNKRMDFTETIQAIRMIKRLYPAATRVLIEDKANGSAITNVLSREMFIIPVIPRGGKVARLNAVSPAIESGHVKLPIGAPWVEEFINQFSAFPNGQHDDMVDSSTQALSFMLFTTGDAAWAHPAELTDETSRRLLSEEEVVLDGDLLYDVYSNNNY